MAKKKYYRRPNISQDVLERARAERQGEKTSIPTAAGAAENGVMAAAAKPKPRAVTGLASRRIPTQEELKQEYAYVIKDMRGLATLAGLLFAMIIVAAILMPSLIG